MTTEEQLFFAKQLQSHHYFFRLFWDIGYPIVEDFPDLPTAAIEFDKKGNGVKFLINKTFWSTLNEHTKFFIICHEMCHLLFNHGERFVEYLGTKHLKHINYAADVVINEMLVEHFGFYRSELEETIREKGCWYSTMFEDLPIEKNQSTEYYLNILKNMNNIPEDLFSFDQHRISEENIEDIEAVKDLLVSSGAISVLKNSKILEKLPDEVSEKLAGTEEGSFMKVDFTKKVTKKWETIIKKWEALQKKIDIKKCTRWERTNPLYSQLISKNSHLPSELNCLANTKKKNKKDVFFFLDTSGSCIHLANRFFSAAHSLDPKKFNVRLFCFDTKVKETSLKSKAVYGGGGTSFHIIEKHIQKILTEEKKGYPKAVFIITDGWGTKVEPLYPKRWYWFLSEKCTQYIPKDSHIFDLSNFE